MKYARVCVCIAIYLSILGRFDFKEFLVDGVWIVYVH